jgi:glutamate racemase
MKNHISCRQQERSLWPKNQKEEILEYENTDLLLKMNCKLIVVACNTATTNAIRELRANMTFHWYRTCNKTCLPRIQKTRKIGILATGNAY